MRTKQVKGIVEDILKLPNALGLEILASLLSPPNEKNVIIF